MLVIRNEQMDALAQPARFAFINEMISHMQQHFPELLVGMVTADIYHRIDCSVRQAAGFELISRRDVCRFLNLCGVYGWDFLDAPENQWMLAQYLGNVSITEPSERIQLLVDQCLWRMEVANHNQRLEQDTIARSTVQLEDNQEGLIVDDLPLLGKDLEETR